MHDLLTTAEAARRLGISRTTLTRWVAAGKLKPAATATNGTMLFDPVVVGALPCPTCGRIDITLAEAS